MKQEQLELLSKIFLYPNCDMLVTRYSPRKFKAIEMFTELIQEINDSDEEYPFAHMDKYRLILRPISDMTQEEKMEDQHIFHCVANKNLNQHAKRALRTEFLLKRSFDLFGLIESGQAIDATKGQGE